VCTRERLVGFDETKIGMSGSDEEVAEMKNQRLRKHPMLCILQWTSLVDETGCNLTTTQATRGRSKKGTPASAAVRYNKGENHSLLLSLHMDIPGLGGRIPWSWKQGRRVEMYFFF
jgi:hypothetical protein